MSTIVTIGNAVAEMGSRIERADAELVRMIVDARDEQNSLLEEVNNFYERIIGNLEKHRIALGKLLGDEYNTAVVGDAAPSDKVTALRAQS